MNVKQMHTILNQIAQEVVGETAVVEEDLSNVIDVGTNILNSTSVDNYVKKLVDKIGRTIFVDRDYSGTAPNIMRDSWDYGSILEKVRCELPEAQENKTWSLVKGESVDPFVFSPPDVSAKFFNSKTTFEIPISFTDVQVKESFRSATDLNKFFSMIANRIRMFQTMCSDSMVMRTIDRLIVEKISNNSNVINLLSNYNTLYGTDLTKEKAIVNKDFLRYATATIMLFSDRIKNASTLYNNDGVVTFTPKNKQQLVLLSEFANNLNVFLLSDTYHNEILKLGGYDTVPYWQGSGNNANAPLAECSKIHMKVKEDGVAQEYTGIVGVLFDKDSCAVCNENPRVTSQYNAKGEYTNYFYKTDCSYLVDTAENCVVFTLGN